ATLQLRFASGTTLAYLTEEAYVPFVDVITRSVLQSVQSVMSKGSQCYEVTSRKLEQVVGIVKSCSPNMLGDLNVTLKDLS
nr:aspartic proteinase-like protein 2 [Tanacetum cinerariifolium]